MLTTIVIALACGIAGGLAGHWLARWVTRQQGAAPPELFLPSGDSLKRKLLTPRPGVGRRDVYPPPLPAVEPATPDGWVPRECPPLSAGCSHPEVTMSVPSRCVVCGVPRPLPANEPLADPEE